MANKLTDTDLPAFNDLQAKLQLGAPARPPPHASGPAQPRVGRRQLRGRPRRETRATFVTAARNDLAAVAFETTLGAASLVAHGPLLVREHGPPGRGRAVPQRGAALERRRTRTPRSRKPTSSSPATSPCATWPCARRRPCATGRHLLEAGFEVHALETRTTWNITGDRNPYEANGSSLRGGAGLPDVARLQRDSTRLGAYVQDTLSWDRLSSSRDCASTGAG